MKLHAPFGLGAGLHTVASLLWLPQAGALAYAVGQLARGGSFESAILPAAIVLGCGLLRTVLDYQGAALCHKQALAAITDVRLKGLAALERQSPTDKERILSGEAANLLTEQTHLLLPFFSRFGAVRLKAMLVPVMILIAIAPFSWLAPLILLFCLPPIPLFAALIGWRAKKTSEQQLHETTSLNGFLLDRLRGLPTLRSLNAIALTAQQFRAVAENVRNRTMQVLRVAFLTSAVLELFSALGVAFMAVFIGFHMLDELPFGAWGGTLSLGEGLFILMLAPAFFEPLRDLSAIWHDKAAAEAAWKALQTLEQPRQTVLGTGKICTRASALPPSITISATHHASISVPAGTKVALWGASGSGKTLLLSAIAGLCPYDGDIWFNDILLTADNADSYRSSMEWLDARPFFKAGSVRHNLGLNGQTPSSEQTRSMLDKVGLAAIPAERIIGENGAGLSGGEALRLAMARLANKPNATVLLMDEPTAHLDRPTADAIITLITNHAPGKTVIIATHDPALAAAMDSVISLDGTSPKALPLSRRKQA